jgi:hypothetical protein
LVQSKREGERFTDSSEKRSIRSAAERTSESTFGDQPRRAMKLTTAAGRKPRSAY